MSTRGAALCAVVALVATQSCGGDRFYPPCERDDAGCPDRGYSDSGSSDQADIGELDARSAMDAADDRPSVLDASDTSVVTDAGWVHFALVPADCALDVATRPGSLVASLDLAACGPGCRRGLTSYAFLGVFRIGSRTVAGLRSVESGAAFHQYTYLVDLDGGTLLAFRAYIDLTHPGVAQCGAEVVAAYGTEFGVEVDYVRYDSSGAHPLEAWIDTFRGSYDSFASTATRMSHAPLDTSAAITVPTAMGMGADFSSYVYAQGLFASQSDGSVRNVSGSLHLVVAQPYHVAEDILFGAIVNIDPRLYVIARSMHGADATVLRSVADIDIFGFSADSTTLAWMEGAGFDASSGDYATIALYSGTYAGGAILANHVRDLPAHHPGVSAFGGGYYAVVEYQGTSHLVYAVYRLSDGARAVFDPAPSEAERIYLVSGTEFVFDAHATIYRIDPTSLTFS